MNHTKHLLRAAMLCGAVFTASAQDAFRQTYPLSPEAVKSNQQKVAADTAKAPDAWKQAPVAFYSVPAMSATPRLPDAYPDDGEAFAPVRFIAAKDEFEPASLIVYPKSDAGKFEIQVGDLKTPDGAVIPASELDVKMVKVWYQQGAAWFGYWADYFRRRLIPELLLHDETLIRVDTKTQDNYVRYLYPTGETKYEWISAGFDMNNHQYTNLAREYLITDADTMKPVVLNKDEMKQFVFTLHVPKDAKEGNYTGSLALLLDGKKIGDVPVKARVLPFELPSPKTNYNLNKNFFVTLYGADSRAPKVRRNLYRHGAWHSLGFPAMDPFLPERSRQNILDAKKDGFPLDKIFSSVAGCGSQRVTGDAPTPKEQKDLDRLARHIDASRKLMLELLGHTEFYSYGRDEGSANVIRTERAAWRLVHKAGGKVMVTTYPHRELLFALDYMIVPGQPNVKKMNEVNLFHESNPDSLVGWYADPHSGPENPDFFRRLHGMMAYKANYDASSNYAWYRNNWNDWAIGEEEEMRGLIMVYLTRDDVIDTLAWEGVREGVDDIRYATKLKMLALEAMASKDADTQLLGRRILSRLAFFDAKRGAIDEYRMEAINNIIQLQNALKGQK